MSILLALKLVLVPLLVALITLAGRRWGPEVAGWLSTFPVVAGPILLFLALERGPEFGAVAAAGTMTGVMATVLYAVAYAWAATRTFWPLAWAAGMTTFAMVAVGLSLVSLPFAVALTLNVAVVIAAPRVFPASGAGRLSRPDSAWEIPLRMMAGAALVLLVTGMADELGPRVSGIVAVFPVMGSVLAVFSHRNGGAGTAIALLYGTLFGWYAFLSFCVALTFLLPLVGTGLGFVLAYGIAAVVQAGSRKWARAARPG